MTAKLARVVAPAAFALAACAAPALAQDNDAPVSITDIRQEGGESSTRLVVQSSGPLAYTYYSPDPLTLVVDIPEVDASGVPSRINVGTREVESLRVTQLARADGRNLARLEVRLASLCPYQIYSKDKTLNLVFERGGRSAAVTPPPVVERVAAAPPAAPKLAQADPPAAVAEPAAGGPAALAAAEPPEEVAPAPREAASRRPPAALPAQRATAVFGVTSSEEDGQLSFTVKANGRLQYQDFFLRNPDRLVVDFRDVVSGRSHREEVQKGAVQRVRLGQFSSGSPKVARLVLELASRKPYHVVQAADGLRIVFGEGRTPEPAPLAARKPEPEPEAAPPPAAARPVVPRLVTPVALPALPAVQAPDPAPQEPEAPADATKKWTGHPISLDFKDGDLQDIFRLFADISGLNVVVNPGIAGRVTLKLQEVPWDQALDLILKINGLGYAIEDNVLRIAKLTDMQKEEADKRKLQEEKQLAGDLVDWSKRIFYAKADVLSDVIKKAGALSPRGQLNVDVRTNTLLMRDLDRFIDKAKVLVADLDVATPQVEIEAKIIVTNRNFTRDIGIQWGFLSRQEFLFGNQTNRAFPNSIILNGQGVPNTQGLDADQAGLASPAGIGVANRGYAVNLPAAGFNSALGVSLGNILGNFNLDAAITALERQGRGRILSTPRVTTQNNQAAEIKQGVQIPIQTVANNTVTVSFRDAVLTLKVTPQISEAGTVILALEVQNDAPDFANLVNGIPPINTQSAKTNVLVKDGSTAVIGGIYQSQEQTSQNSTPFFSKIPILGSLFKNKFVTNSNSELLLFITPRIIKG